MFLWNHVVHIIIYNTVSLLLHSIKPRKKQSLPAICLYVCLDLYTYTTDFDASFFN